MKALALPVALSLLAAACAAKPEPPQFPVTGTPPSLSQMNNDTAIAWDISKQISTQVSKTDGTIAIGGNEQAIEKDIVAELKKQGYRFALRNAKHTITYSIEPVGPALLVRVRVDDTQIAWMYRSGATGEVVPGTSISVTRS